MYTVKVAARAAGVTPATLRTWERRYAVVEPQRTESGYRLYDDAAIARLREMAALVAAGWSARQAAERVRSAPGDPLAPVVPGPTGPPRSAAGGRDPLPTAERDPGLGELAQCAVAFDPARLTATLDAAFARGSFEEVVEEWLLPEMVDLGTAWAEGVVSIAGEHFVSAAAGRRLAVAFEEATTPPGAPRVLVGLPLGARHEIGVQAFATMLRRAGVDVQYVGASLPAGSWVEAATLGRAVAVVLSIPTISDIAAARETVTALRRAHPHLPVFLGGNAQSGLAHSRRGAGAPVVGLGHNLRDATRALTTALGASEPPVA